MNNMKKSSYILIILFISLFSDGYASNPQIGNSALKFRNVGPSRGGRVTAVCGVNSIPGTFYQGATGGGVWKTTDYGFHWRNISDGYFATPSIGAISVYQVDPNIIYVGTGSDGIRSNVIVGKGMYKSTDAGETWSFVGLKNAGQIGSVIIHPKNPDIVYVAAIGQAFRKSKERGVYRSQDGGQHWENILYLSDSVGAVDLEFAPDNPEVIYAAMWRAERKPWTIISGGASDGIYKSDDSGKTWQKKTKGLPTALVGKIDFAVSGAKPERVWAQVQASDGQEGIYLSDDYAETWQKVKMPKGVHKSIMYRPFYFTNLTANPCDADHIFGGTKQYWESKNGGESWANIPTTHSDHHDLWINPNDPKIMIEGNDGGAAISRDGGQNWSTVFNQPTAELYSCNVDDQYPYYLYSGQQDNSTIRVPSKRPFIDVLRSNDNHGLNDVMLWERVGGCETGPAIAKPGDPNIVYANCKGQFSVFNKTTGQEQYYYVGAESLYSNDPDDVTYRFQRVTPMEVSPHDPNTVYYGSQYVHKTVNGGKTWAQISPDLTANLAEYSMRSGGPIDEDISGEENYAALYAIQESPIEKGVIWTGSNDGLFYVSRDGGKHWENVTPEMPEGGRVSNIEASPHNPAKAYYAVYRDYLGDETPYLFKTENYGRSWKKIVHGIPTDYPSRVVREDPDKEGLLYAGTEFGLFISFDDGKKWKSFQLNLPIVPVTDISVIRKDLAISTLGRSFWVLDDISPLHSYQANENNFNFYKPRDVIENHQNFYFSLPENKSESVLTLEVLNERKIVYTKEYNVSNIKQNRLGVYKIEWDLRYEFNNEKTRLKGPAVSPGEYLAILTFEGSSYEQKFSYNLHPELRVSGTSVADLKTQEHLGLKTAKLLFEIKKEIFRLESEITNSKTKEINKNLTTKLGMLKKGSKRYDKPKLQEHTDYLYKMIKTNPQKLGKDAFVRFNQLKKLYDNYMNLK